MGFGKRSATQPRSASQPGSGDSSDIGNLRVAHQANSQGGDHGTLLTVAVGIVSVAVGIGAALFYGSSATESGSGAAVAARTSGGGAHARIASACMPPVGNGLRPSGMSDEELRHMVALTSHKYFTCALPREPERFCAADEKATLVKELLTYFGDVAREQRMYDKYVGDPSAKTMIKMMEAVDGKDEGAISARRRRPEPDATVVDLMQGLVRDGYLQAGDFGWSLPKEVAPYLAGVKKIKSSC